MGMKRLLCLFFAFLMLLSPLASLAEEMPNPTLSPDANPYDEEHPELLEEEQLYATAAILIEEHTGRVIFEKNADMVLYPASTTKIMTVLLGLMMGNMSDTVTVSANAMNIPDDSSTMGLRLGEEINFQDLLYGTIMRSGNEGANAIAEYISGDIPTFVNLMNETAQRYGMTNTHFMNPHGLHDDNHYSTARDLATLAREALKNNDFRQIVGTVSYNIPRTNEQRARTITTRHRILIPSTEENSNRYYYEYATGVKSGSHSKAGYCYVGSATKDGVDLISVVMYSGERTMWFDTKKLFEYGFSQFVSVSPIDLYNMNPITIETTSYSLHDANMGRLSLSCVASDARANLTEITATNAEIAEMADNLRDTVLIQYQRDFAAPITAGEIMGTMTYYPENEAPVVYNLVADRSIAKRENAPKTLEEIVAMTEADPNPFPPLSVELVLILLSPLLVFILIILILRAIFRRRKKKQARLPKNSKRYLK